MSIPIQAPPLADLVGAIYAGNTPTQDYAAGGIRWRVYRMRGTGEQAGKCYPQFEAPLPTQSQEVEQFRQWLQKETGAQFEADVIEGKARICGEWRSR